MRIVYFGSGSPLSLACLEALAPRGELVAVIVPSGWRRRRSRRPLAKLARGLSLPVVQFGDDVPEADLFVIASFPHILPRRLLAKAALGALNVHPSLLPKHRGPDPLFWSYFADDAESGATIHWISDRVDAGDIVAQTRMPIARGRAVRELYVELAQHAARSLADAVDRVARGTASRTPQDESAATHDPSPRPGTFTIDLATWPAERVWHLLSGLGAQRHDLLGPGFAHNGEARFVLGPHARAGSIEKTARGFRVHCADGYVDVGRAPMAVRLRAIARRLLRR